MKKVVKNINVEKKIKTFLQYDERMSNHTNRELRNTTSE